MDTLFIHEYYQCSLACLACPDCAAFSLLTVTRGVSQRSWTSDRHVQLKVLLSNRGEDLTQFLRATDISTVAAASCTWTFVVPIVLRRVHMVNKSDLT